MNRKVNRIQILNSGFGTECARLGILIKMKFLLQKLSFFLKFWMKIQKSSYKKKVEKNKGGG